MAYLEARLGSTVKLDIAVDTQHTLERCLVPSACVQCLDLLSSDLDTTVIWRIGVISILVSVRDGRECVCLEFTT